MIHVLNASTERQANLKRVTACNRTEAINGEYLLDFEAILDDRLLQLVSDASMFELEGDYFDSNKVTWLSNEDGSKTIKIESEHVSYRLNDPDYNMEYFASTGTAYAVLSEILDGTGFTAGAVEYSGNITYSIQEAKSRRQMLTEFTELVDGELVFDKFEISIVSHRGSTESKPVLKDRNVKVVSKVINKKELDSEGNPKVSYGCDPTYLPQDTYNLGDDIVLLQGDLGIAEALRVVKVEYNPYDRSQSRFTFSNEVNGLENSVYKIITESVSKDKLYYGCRIGPENGFEVIRSDNTSRAFFRSDAFKIQKGDGGGENWDDVFYIDEDGNIIMQGSIAILNVNGDSTIIDSYGIDPKYLDYSKNLVWNSGFEVFNNETFKPFHWSAGVCSPDSSFYGSHSLKLEPSELTRQSWAASISPDWIGRKIVRMSFYANFVVDFKIRVVDIGTWIASGGTIIRYYTLTHDDGVTTGTELQYTGANGWEDSRITLTFDTDEFTGVDTRFAIEIENVDTIGDIYIDGMMMHPDFTEKWPQLYKAGPRSTTFVNAGDAYTDSDSMSATEPVREYNKLVISDTEPADKTVAWLDIS